jgi:hypothetical protein
MKYGRDQYLLRIRRQVSWWPTQPVKRMPRLARTLALLGAILALCTGAATDGAAESAALAQPWDPVPWVIVASGVVIASLAAADAKADRRRH